VLVAKMRLDNHIKMWRRKKENETFSLLHQNLVEEGKEDET
jgi:hypothetical protein